MREPCYDIYAWPSAAEAISIIYAHRVARLWYFGYAQVMVDRLRADGLAVKCILNRGPGTLHIEILLPRGQFKE